MFEDCASETAAIWTHGAGRPGVPQGTPIGSPAWYSYSQPQVQPPSAHAYHSPPRAQPAKWTGPRNSAMAIAAAPGDFPRPFGSVSCTRFQHRFPDGSSS